MGNETTAAPFSGIRLSNYITKCTVSYTYCNGNEHFPSFLYIRSYSLNWFRLRLQFRPFVLKGAADKAFPAPEVRIVITEILDAGTAIAVWMVS